MGCVKHKHRSVIAHEHLRCFYARNGDPTFQQFNSALYKTMKTEYGRYVKHIGDIMFGRTTNRMPSGAGTIPIDLSASGCPCVPDPILGNGGFESANIQQKIIMAYWTKMYGMYTKAVKVSNLIQTYSICMWNAHD